MEDDMAEVVPGTGPAAAPPAGAAQGQQLIINAQYIKDLSFENPRAPQSLMQQATPPSVEINIDVKAQGIGPENYEVVLTINASAKSQNDTLFLIELTYGAVVTVRNVPQEMMPQTMPGYHGSRCYINDRSLERPWRRLSPARAQLAGNLFTAYLPL
jgi:protein-export chaperone SecB